MKFVVKLSKEEQFIADNPLIGWRKTLRDGQTVEYPVLLRDPVTPEERRTVREQWANNIDNVRRRLAKKDCPKCKGKGTYDVSDYPDHPLYSKLVSSEIRGCFLED
jgi:hypothetical protein